MKQIAILLFLTLACVSIHGQTTINSNNPTGSPTAHLGWDDIGNSQLWINQNNINRMHFNSEFYAPINTNTLSSVNRIAFDLQSGTIQTKPHFHKRR